MGDENQVVENSSEAVSEVVSENSTEVVKPVKVKKERVKKTTDENKNLIIVTLTESSKTQKQVAESTKINGALTNVLLRGLVTEGKIKREKTKIEGDKVKSSFVYSLV